jgi:small multidrug resistance family-3 protein
VIRSLAWYGLAAFAEIAGCFAFWAWLRLAKSPWWLVPGMGALVTFAWALTRIDAGFAGRMYAAYGGVYIAASLLWLRGAEGHQAGPLGPDRCSGVHGRSGGHPPGSAPVRLTDPITGQASIGYTVVRMVTREGRCEAQVSSFSPRR